MTRPDLDALQALYEGAMGADDFGKRVDLGAQLAVAAVNALPGLLAYVRELERERDAAALAMREKCAQACEKLAYAEHQTGKVDHNEQAWTRVCAAAVRALEP